MSNSEPLEYFEHSDAWMRARYAAVPAPMSAERLAEIAEADVATPEWRGGPDWTFHAVEQRRELLAEVARMRGRWM